MEYPQFQALVTEAYEKYSPDYASFLASLDKRTAGYVTLANLNNQMATGGYRLWYLNGYHVGLPYLQKFLNKIIGTVEARDVAKWTTRAVQDLSWNDEKFIGRGRSSYDTRYNKTAPILLKQVEDSLTLV